MKAKKKKMANVRTAKRTNISKSQKKTTFLQKLNGSNNRLSPFLVFAIVFGLFGGITFIFKGHAEVLAEWNVECSVDHYSKDDPIVYPGVPGAAHMHSFYGNKTTNAYSTPSSINSGASNCNYISEYDHSAYWVPSIYYTNPDGTSTQYTSPDQSVVAYYRRPGGSSGPKVQLFPKGLVMIGGDAKATSAQSLDVVQWDCTGGNEYPGMITCPGTESASLTGEVIFPSCWDGVHLDSADHKSHMAYPDINSGSCPSDHPVSLPQLSMDLHYPLLGGGSNYFLSSGGIYSLHADFMEGWNTQLEQGLIDNCLNVKINSCHTIQVWDGGEVTINNGVTLFNLNDYSSASPTPTPTTPAPTVTFTASPASITSGQSSVLTWNSTNATSCAAVAPTGFSISGTSGTQTVAPTASTTYKISCTGSGGTATATTNITVSAPTSTATPPVVSITASPASIKVGQSSAITWNSTDATSCVATAPTGFTVTTTSGTQTVSPSTKTTYSIKCSNATGSTSASVTVNVSKKRWWSL